MAYLGWSINSTLVWPYDTMISCSAVTHLSFTEASYHGRIVWKRTHSERVQKYTGMQSISLLWQHRVWLEKVWVSVNQFPNTFQGKIESWIARPTHCRNIGPEALSLVVLLEVNGNDTKARISRKHRQEHSLGLYTKSCFSALLTLCFNNTGGFEI